MFDDNFGSLCQLCKRRDYIPFHCKKCNKKLCDEHYWNKEVHSCVIHMNNKTPNQGKKRVQHHCQTCKCKLYTVNHFYCNDCEKLYCLKHRLPEEHKCKKMSENSSSCVIM